MRRVSLLSRYHEDGNESIDTTPLARAPVRLPRLRLLDKIAKSEDVPVIRQDTSQIVKIYPLFVPKQTCLEDRFIFRRSNHNVEAANYLLTKKIINTSKLNQLDVFTQVESLKINWRKKCMHNLMIKENAIPGLGQKQVLRGNYLSPENKLPGSTATKPKDLLDEEYLEDGIWKSKPRKRPLIGAMDSILDMSEFRSPSRFGQRFIDWSSRNIIAAVIQNSMTFFHADMPETIIDPETMEASDTCCLKWNNAGDKLVICTMSSEMKLYSMDTQKMIWIVNYESALNSTCYVHCICWSHDDKYIVTSCGKCISVYSEKTGSFLKSVVAHDKTILTLSFSSNHRYLVSSSTDTSVRIFVWPTLDLLMDIAYYGPIKAIAWHPFESNLLCVGGSLGDASLSLWNVNKLELVSFKLVNFHGAVENLAWNKISGELIVHWRYWEGQTPCSIMPVLASLNRVVDAIPVKKDSIVSSVMWNPNHTQIAFQYNEALSIWNFFGYENQRHPKQREQQKSMDASVKGFRQFHIR